MPLIEKLVCGYSNNMSHQSRPTDAKPQPIASSQAGITSIHRLQPSPSKAFFRTGALSLLLLSSDMRLAFAKHYKPRPNKPSQGSGAQPSLPAKTLSVDFELEDTNAYCQLNATTNKSQLFHEVQQAIVSQCPFIDEDANRSASQNLIPQLYQQGLNATLFCTSNTNHSKSINCIEAILKNPYSVLGKYQHNPKKNLSIIISFAALITAMSLTTLSLVVCMVKDRNHNHQHDSSHDGHTQATYLTDSEDEQSQASMATQVSSNQV